MANTMNMLGSKLGYTEVLHPAGDVVFADISPSLAGLCLQPPATHSSLLNLAPAGDTRRGPAFGLPFSSKPGPGQF
jgi:hypothetical protein